MANLRFILECDNCLEEYTVEKWFDAKNSMPTAKTLFKKALEEGWHIGFRTLCPECATKQRNICSNCVHYVNKTFEAPYCDFTENATIVLANDFCDKWKGRNSV